MQMMRTLSVPVAGDRPSPKLMQNAAKRYHIDAERNKRSANIERYRAVRGPPLRVEQQCMSSMLILVVSAAVGEWESVLPVQHLALAHLCHRDEC